MKNILLLVVLMTLFSCEKDTLTEQEEVVYSLEVTEWRKTWDSNIGTWIYYEYDYEEYYEDITEREIMEIAKTLKPKEEDNVLNKFVFFKKIEIWKDDLIIEKIK